MRFRLWLEDKIGPDEGKRFVLNALNASDQPEDEIASILGSPMKNYPDLAKKLVANDILKSYASKIEGHIYGNGKESVQELIIFLAGLDGPGPEKQPEAPPVEPQPLGSTSFGDPEGLSPDEN